MFFSRPRAPKAGRSSDSLLSIVLTAALAVSGAAASFAQPFGITERVPNTDLLIGDLPAFGPTQMQLKRVWPRITIPEGVALRQAPGDNERLYIGIRWGWIISIPKTDDPAPEDYLQVVDISARTDVAFERGLLDFVFDPRFETNRHIYLSYTYEDGSQNGVGRVSRFTMTDGDAPTIDVDSELVILEIPHYSPIHHAGQLQFGPDDHLYYSVGDGGIGPTVNIVAQDTTSLRGKILRLDVHGTPDSGLNYRIPRDNPFYVTGPAGDQTRKEIFAYGFRNPWRFSFDPFSNVLIAGDVGDIATDSIESVEVVRSGGNYGWPIMEGSRCFQPPTGCNSTGLERPIFEYQHYSASNAIIGGYVYFGKAAKSLHGYYVFGDWGSGDIYALRYDGFFASGAQKILETNLQISSFGSDRDGELYIFDQRSQAVYTIVPQNPAAEPNFPTRLSDHPALLKAAAGRGHEVPGVIFYEPSAKLWSDHTGKERYFAVPGVEKIGYRDIGGFEFPNESVIVKNFGLPTDFSNPQSPELRIETRILVKRNNVWHGFSYEWNKEETDGILLPGNRERYFDLKGTQGEDLRYRWYYPSRNECRICHTPASNTTLGLTAHQLNYEITYPGTNFRSNQIATLNYISIFDSPLPAGIPDAPAMEETTASIRDRARAYLDANCSMCHQPGGSSRAQFDARYSTHDGGMKVIGVHANLGNFGIEEGLLIKPGDPDNSVLLHRMKIRGTGQMPPIATSIVDEEAVALIEAWIRSMENTDKTGMFVY